MSIQCYCLLASITEVKFSTPTSLSQVKNTASANICYIAFSVTSLGPRSSDKNFSNSMIFLTCALLN